MLTDLRATADSADGLVGATVDAHGQLVSVTLDPRALRGRDEQALSATITETVQEAVRQARLAVFAVVEPMLPADATLASTDLDFDPFLAAVDDNGFFLRARDILLRVRDRMEGLRFTEDSADGLATATVDARGVVVDLQLDGRIYRDLDSARVTRAVEDATRRAAALAVAGVTELYRSEEAW